MHVSGFIILGACLLALMITMALAPGWIRSDDGAETEVPPIVTELPDQTELNLDGVGEFEISPDLTGTPGAVIELDNSSLTQSTLNVDSQGRGQANQLGRDQDLVVVVLEPAIGSQILALCVGVDRHLSNLASTNRADVVDGHGPTTLEQ